MQASSVDFSAVRQFLLTSEDIQKVTATLRAINSLLLHHKTNQNPLKQLDEIIIKHDLLSC